jgi:protease-4
VGWGVAWHHYFGSGPLHGLNAFDFGLSMRFGNHVAVGAVLRDVSTGDVAMTPVQRRYELEADVRPLATDALELAAGGRIGETRGDIDAWGRVSFRAARGVYIHGLVESRALEIVDDDATIGRVNSTGRDVRATLGLELSFGNLGIAAYGTGLRDERGKSHALGSTMYARAALYGTPSVIGPTDHIERIELSGTIGVRELTSLVMRLREIAKDPSAKGLVVMFDSPTAGWAALQELRTEIAAVRKTGKKVFAYMVSGSSRDYFVATAADKIYLDPAGGLRLVGISGTTMYYRGILDLIGVQPQFEKIAEYKSAPEQFTETHPTETAAKMHNDMFDSLWDQWVAAVADGRHMSPDEVKALVDKGPYTSGDLAKNAKLVDAIGMPDKISELVIREVGQNIGIATPPLERPDRWHRPGIAVVYVDGDITDGKSQNIPFIGRSLAGGETLVAALAAARNDPRVGAVILRIDSPGGSAVASELIAREVFATRGVKPMICSMGDYAASGGYFVAAGCETIFAEPMTITGSIGIFHGKADLSGLFAKLGITTDTYKRGKHADAESYYRPYTDEERGMLLDELRYMYTRFIGAVADGRGMKKDDVDKIGRGHVYTGAAAANIHLVDHLGGLGDAIDEAKRRMHLSPSAKIQIYELPKLPTSLFGTVGALLGANAQTSLSLFDLPVLRELLRAVPPSMLVAPDSNQARLPYEFDFR